MNKKRISVAEYLTQQIAISGVSQKEIAEALNYDKPNIITMFKQGKTKIPLNKVAPLAKILGIDPVHFLRMTMLEYSPETWEVLESMMGQRLVSQNEQRVLDLVRSATGGRDIAPKNEEQEHQLIDLFASWAKTDETMAEGLVEAGKRRKTA